MVCPVVAVGSVFVTGRDPEGPLVVLVDLLYLDVLNCVIQLFPEGFPGG